MQLLLAEISIPQTATMNIKCVNHKNTEEERYKLIVDVKTLDNCNIINIEID